MDKKTKIKVLTLMFLSALFLTAAGCQTKETTKMESKIYEAKTETVIENEEKIKDEEKVLDEKEGEVLGDGKTYEKKVKVVSDIDYFPPSFEEDDIPLSKTIVFYNPTTGKDEETIGYLTEKGVDENTKWEEVSTSEVFFESEGNQSAEFMFEDGKTILVDINSESPTWEGYEKDICRMLGMNPDETVLKEAYWAGEKYDSEGKVVRKAVFVTGSDKKGFYATYEGNGYEIETVR